jgi:asparagine synthase (glutamine-hydrolysing)
MAETRIAPYLGVDPAPSRTGFAAILGRGQGDGFGSAVATRLGCQVLFRGYIANRSSLAQDLPETEHEDELLIAVAYRRWGESLQRHVLGEYAVAVYDAERRYLFATHDALGLRPLYYAQHGAGIVVGSHLGRVAALAGLGRLEERYVGDFLLHGVHAGPLTIHRGVLRLQAGESLEWSPAGLHVHQTWSLAEVAPAAFRTEAEYDERFRELLVEGVRTAAAGRTWCELSGGLDSSTVLCLAHQLGIDDLQALSVRYCQSPTADEHEWMRVMINATGVPWNVLDGDAEQPFSELPDRPLDQPSRVSMMWRLFRAYEDVLGNNGVRVLLSGYGGDQALFGDLRNPIHLADRLRRGQFLRALRDASAWQHTASARRSKLHILIKHGWEPLSHYVVGQSVSYERNPLLDCPWLNEGFIRRIGLRSGHPPGDRRRMPTVRGQFYHERLWRISLVSGQIWNQITSTFEMRFPLLYRPLIEFMYSLPAEQQVQPGNNRVLQRRALSGILPDRIRERRDKKGPDQSFFEGLRRNPEIYRLLVDRPRIVELGFVDRDRWREAASSARFGCVSSIAAFYSAFNLEVWLRQRESH